MTWKVDLGVCIRCLAPRARHRFDVLERGGEEWLACRDLRWCQERQARNRASHAREVRRRLADTSGRYSHLIVFLDTLGQEFGYGNFYVGVEVGQSPAAVAAERIGDDSEEALVIEVILPIGAEYSPPESWG